jgi:hypothetical protein
MTQHIAIPSSPAARAEPWRGLRAVWRRFGLHLVGFASLFVLWHVISVYVFRSILFPPPLPVFRRGIELIENGKLFVEVDASLLRILAGFTLGSLLGVALGLLVGSFNPVRRLLEPYVETLRFIPAVALITVAVIWFGIGESSKVFIITYATVFIVLITTAAGVVAIARRKPHADFFLRYLAGDSAIRDHRNARGDGQCLHHHRGSGAGGGRSWHWRNALERAPLHDDRGHFCCPGRACRARFYHRSLFPLAQRRIRRKILVCRVVWRFRSPHHSCAELNADF